MFFLNLSREHNACLVFALRLQKGVAKKASIQEMDDYILWYWEVHLNAHFQMEETHLFPKLDSDEILMMKAYKNHKLIKKLIQESLNLMEVLFIYLSFLKPIFDLKNGSY